MDAPKSPSLLRHLLRDAGQRGLNLSLARLGIHKEWPAASRYGFALFVSAGAVALRLVMLREFDHDVLRLLSVIAVALAAWFGGFGPGMLATVIGLAGTFATRTGNVREFFDLTHGIRLVLALLTGLIVSGLIEALSRTATAWRLAEEAREKEVLQERNRLAREIHDTLAQGLTGIIIQLEAAEDILGETPGRDAVRAHLARAQDLARVSLTEARRSVSALRPLCLEGQGLAAALEERLIQMTAGTGIEAALTLSGTSRPLPADCEDNLLRIGLEAVTNALKHARALSIRVQLAFTTDQVTLSVHDDGQGFPSGATLPDKGFGIVGMQERAERIGGQFSLFTCPGQGARVTVTVPLTDGALTDRLSATKR